MGDLRYHEVRKWGSVEAYRCGNCGEEVPTVVRVVTASSFTAKGWWCAVCVLAAAEYQREIRQ